MKLTAKARANHFKKLTLDKDNTIELDGIYIGEVDSLSLISHPTQIIKLELELVVDEVEIKHD